MSLRPSSIVLVLANLVPIAGVLLFDWRVIDILILYWAENVIIGIINLARMALSEGNSKWFTMLLFAAHYGIFCFGHLAAVTTLFSDTGDVVASVQDFLRPLWIAVAAIAASHLFSFFMNFVAGGEYRRTSLRTLMHRPYGRIIALHVAVVIGAVLIELLGSPVMMLLVLVAVKIAIDLRLHDAERQKFGELPAA